jgi:hypothetical protein
VSGRIEAELKIPTVSVVGPSFVNAAKAAAESVGMPNLRLAVYPGVFETDAKEVILSKVEKYLYPDIVKALTTPVKASEAAAAEAKPDAVIFSGTYEEVNEFFTLQNMGDGLPIVPPTVEKVREFLKYTDRAQTEVLGAMPNENREVTVWKVAVNGVMAGCKPEYMPVLIAVAEALADPHFGKCDSTTGPTAMVTLNGPIVHDLDFNASIGVQLPGNQANSTVGRFIWLMLRNIGRLLHGSASHTFGRNFWVALAENEAENPWQPLSVDRGFRRGDNVVTLVGVTSDSYHLKVMGTKAKEMLDNLAASLKLILLSGDLQGCIDKRRFREELSYQLVLAPPIAQAFAKGGYSKSDVQKYLFEHTKVTRKEFDDVLVLQTGGVKACDYVKQGVAQAQFCPADPQALVPLYFKPDDLLIIVSGDIERNRFFVTTQSGQGYATSKKVELPAKWAELIKAKNK